jgi:hypothetical protein
LHLSSKFITEQDKTKRHSTFKDEDITLRFKIHNKPTNAELTIQDSRHPSVYEKVRYKLLGTYTNAYRVCILSRKTKQMTSCISNVTKPQLSFPETIKISPYPFRTFKFKMAEGSSADAGATITLAGQLHEETRHIRRRKNKPNSCGNKQNFDSQF